MRRWIVGLTAGAVSAVAGYQLAYKPWRQRWDATLDESGKPLAGDDLVPDADYDHTMAVTIDAPPSAVWPWLLQMGYGRGGWYSYDSIDMLGHSTAEVRGELQDLTPGQVVPFAPGMGFRVEVLDPEHALVLYADSALAEAQQRSRDVSAGAGASESVGLRMAGALSDANMREFRVSWAFVLEPLDGEQTRLLERFRTRATPGPATAIVRPVVDNGHFLMTRRHMLGLRERAERLHRSAPEPASAPRPTATPATVERVAVGAAS